MQIESGGKFLVLHAGGAGAGRRVEIVSQFADALGRWTPNTRVSPVWPVSGYSLGLSDEFTERQALLFLGPIQAAVLADDLIPLRTPGAVELWLTPGCFNVLARAPTGAGDSLDSNIQALQAWALAKQVPHELWIVDGGQIQHTTWWTHDTVAAEPHLQALAKLSRVSVEAALKPALQEFLAVQASSLSRSAAMAPELFVDFVTLGESVRAMVDLHKKGDLSALDLNSRLLSLNAALSRASSQTFSGTPPIDGTECHFWVHSLLGTGSANIALALLASWVGGILGAERIPERLKALKGLADAPPDLAAMQDTSLLDAEILHRGTIRADEGGPVVPLITYFSGRDGFSSHLQTLSAPVSTLAECNSYRSSLMTVTHEISHVLIHGVLGVIYPDHTDSKAVEALGATLAKSYRPEDWHASATKLLFEGLIGMEQASRATELTIPEIKAQTVDILLHWRAEAQETLVHTFDFMYFYAGEPDFYIESIWRSWSAIPGIADRIPGYVMRTLCAVSANLLRESPDRRLPAAIKAVRKKLNSLKSAGGLMSDYVDTALRFLEESEADRSKLRRLQEDYVARLYLVRLVAIFLYSDTVAAKLFDDPYVRSGGRASGGKAPLHYDTSLIGNPLTFLKATLKQDPTEAESLWVLHTLAFDMRNSLGGANAGV